MPIDFLKNWMEDRIEDSVTEGRRGEYKPGVLESMAGGLLGLDGQAIADDLKVVDDNTQGEAALTATGRSREQLGLSPGQNLTPEMVQGANANFTQSETERLKEEDNRTATERITLSQQPQLEATRASTEVAQQTLAATIANNNATNSRLMQQGAQSHQLAIMQMADNAESKAQELAYQKMRDRKADMQYNERMEQLDRKDRRQAMSSIAAGLASLGAAFAM